MECYFIAMLVSPLDMQFMCYYNKLLMGSLNIAFESLGEERNLSLSGKKQKIIFSYCLYRFLFPCVGVAIAIS